MFNLNEQQKVTNIELFEVCISHNKSHMECNSLVVLKLFLIGNCHSQLFFFITFFQCNVQNYKHQYRNKKNVFGSYKLLKTVNLLQNIKQDRKTCLVIFRRKNKIINCPWIVSHLMVFSVRCHVKRLSSASSSCLLKE